MASYEGLYEMTDRLEADYNKWHKKSEANSGNEAGIICYYRSQSILECLVSYYETVLKHGKFIDQKWHCQAAIKRMNPAFAEGYFKGKK